MPNLITPVHIAASYALQKYLQSIFQGEVAIEPKWPDADKELPNKGITILPAGPRKIEWLQEPELVSEEDLSPNTMKKYNWRIAECTQDYQLDIWTHYSDDRDDLVARLDRCLNVGDSALSTASLSTPSVDPGVALEMQNGWEMSNAYFLFDTIDYKDSPEQVMRNEFRATYKGSGMFNLIESSINPKLAKINIGIKLGYLPIPVPDGYDQPPDIIIEI